MSQYHQLDVEGILTVNCNDQKLDRVERDKLLGTVIDEHF